MLEQPLSLNRLARAVARLPLPQSAQPAGALGWLLALAVEQMAQVSGLEPVSLPPALRPAQLPPREWLTAARALFAAPDLHSCWQEEESLGWLYQFWSEHSGLPPKGRRKIPSSELSAATRLFTPAWIAVLLVQNTLGRLWLQMHPDSRLIAALPYLAPAAGLPPEPLRSVSQLRLLDPACGGMHIGLAAFDLLVEMYREEMENAGQPGWPAQPPLLTLGQITGAVIEHNLYGWEIDPIALQVAGLALGLRAARTARARGWPVPATRPNLQLLPTPHGALARQAGEPRFDCVVTNPPYRSRPGLPPELAAFLERHYPHGRADLYAAFLLRCLELASPGGRVGVITQQSFMFLPSFQSLRRDLLDQGALEMMAHTGPRAFHTIPGEKVNTTLFVLRREEDPQRRAAAEGVYFRLVGERASSRQHQRYLAAAAAARAGEQPPGFFRRRQLAFDLAPAGQWTYWVPESILAVFSRLPGLNGMDGSDGNKTAANRRFIRPAAGLPPAELENGSWLRLARPQAQLPYRQHFHQVVDWRPAAQAFYHANPSSSPIPAGLIGRAGISWSRVASLRFTARRFPPGVVPDVSTPALYPPADLSAALLALLNSRPGRYLLALLNPTINYALGDVRRFPLPALPEPARTALTALAGQLEDAYNRLEGPPFILTAEITALEQQVDELAYALYGFSAADRRLIQDELPG